MTEKTIKMFPRKSPCAAADPSGTALRAPAGSRRAQAHRFSAAAPRQPESPALRAFPDARLSPRGAGAALPGGAVFIYKSRLGLWADGSRGKPKPIFYCRHSKPRPLRCFYRLPLLISHMITDAATPAFSDSLSGRIGIISCPSHIASSSALRPFPSLPTATACMPLAIRYVMP